MITTNPVDRTPEFSLVLSTKDRTDELAAFLRSLDAQTERSFELIVSDQNEDDRLASVLAPFQQRFPIHYVRSFGGISRGRNAGLPLASGRYIAYPDDDCWYPASLLETVLRLFRKHSEWDVVSGRSVDATMRDTQGRWLDHVETANRGNVLRMGISYTIFARADAVAAAGPFDESLGVGAGTPWGSGEETDFLLRAIEVGKTVIYTPEIFVHHIEKVVDYSKRARDRQHAYARGLGRVLGKHKYSLIGAFHHFARPLAGSALYIMRGRPDRSLYYLRVFAGRAAGWLSGTIDRRGGSSDAGIRSTLGEIRQ
ncbi:MAG: glycosyltransferase [Rhodospirillales bacterium]|nr:glycosyltransferase [Rhodospirillales bacterium]